MANPLVTIIVVSYNHARFINENLDSIKAQNYNNIELILADDASSDNSVEVFEKWSMQNDFKVIKNFHKQNTGLAIILNECLELVTGKYLKLIAADDYLFPNSIKKSVVKLEELGDQYGLYYGNIQVVDENSIDIFDTDAVTFPPDYKVLQGNCFIDCIEKFPFWTQATLYRFDYFKNTKFRFNKDFFSEDWHVILHMARHSKISGENHVFAYYRKLETSITRKSWNAKNLHNIFFSWFDMISTFLNHPKNSIAENRKIEDKLIDILFKIDYHNRSIKKRVISNYFKLLFASKNKMGILQKGIPILKKLRY
jgi:alpha-1,3-rhamnosyltransferase